MELFMGARNLQSWDSLTPLPVPIPLTFTIYFNMKVIVAPLLKANFNYEGRSHLKKGEGLVAGAYVFYLLMSDKEIVQ